MYAIKSNFFRFLHCWLKKCNFAKKFLALKNTKTELFHPVSHDNNMMVVRYYLSFCVLIAHTAVLTQLDLPWIQRGTVDVGCFFAISGFLMFPSFQKHPTWKHYITKRARRILPPYILIVLLCAFLFVFLSNLSFIDYFTNPGFWKYLAANLSFLNFLHPGLPGVFTGEEFTTNAVNGSLWTMKGEWVCYLSVPFVFKAIKKYPKYGGIILLSISIFSILCRYKLSIIEETTGNIIYSILAKQFGTLLVFFYIGALVNFYFPLFLKFKWYIVVLDFIIIYFSEYIPFYSYVLQPIVAGTLVIWFSMVGSWGKKLSKHDSVSYDIYLYHFPIIQLVILWGLPQKYSAFVVLLTVVTISVTFAFLSWNLIGKRFAKIKN